MSGIKYGKIYIPEEEWLGITYVTGERSIVREPVLGMVLGPVIGMVLGTSQVSEVGSRVSGDGKS